MEICNSNSDLKNQPYFAGNITTENTLSVNFSYYAAIRFQSDCITPTLDTSSYQPEQSGTLYPVSVDGTSKSVVKAIGYYGGNYFLNIGNTIYRSPVAWATNSNLLGTANIYTDVRSDFIHKFAGTTGFYTFSNNYVYKYNGSDFVSSSSYNGGIMDLDYDNTSTSNQGALITDDKVFRFIDTAGNTLEAPLNFTETLYDVQAAGSVSAKKRAYVLLKDATNEFYVAIIDSRNNGNPYELNRVKVASSSESQTNEMHCPTPENCYIINNFDFSYFIP
jgi:hypothetical protein